MKAEQWHVSWTDADLVEQLRAQAKRRGIDVDESDDWWQPEDAQRGREFTGTLSEARALADEMALTLSEYGEADLYRVFVNDDGIEDSVLVETRNVEES